MSLSIKIRKHQFVNKQGQNVILNCTGQNVAEWVLGSVDSTWYDVTEDCDGKDELEITIRQNEGTEKMSESGATLQINFTGEASSLINSWLFDTPCSYINFFDVEIEDKVCGIVYDGYELKPDNVEFCEGDGCYYTLSLREGEDKYRALRKLSIHDNWQKWFSEDGNKDHPTFQVVVQQEPTTIGMKASFLLFVISIPIVGWVVNGAGNVKEKFKKILGFGRYHAAPKVYDILLNACMKVGLTLNTPFNPGRELQNDCLFIPYSGIYHTNFEDNPEYRPSPSAKHIWNNRYIWQVTEFIDELCKLYCMKWDIIDGALVIEFQKDIISRTDSYQITDADSVCYEFDLTKKPSYGRYEYTADASDAASNQVQIVYNDIVDYDGVAENPMLEGNVTKSVKFASTGFYGDGYGEDYIAESVQVMKMGALAILSSLVIASAALIAGIDNFIAGAALTAAIGIWITAIITTANRFRDRYRDTTEFSGIIRVNGSGVVTVPRIIRWDSSTPMNNAKAVKVYANTIQVNPKYNSDNESYVDHYTGIGTHKPIDTVFNYPLVFDSLYRGNLYDTYHEVVDNPMIVNMGHQTITAVVPMCCDTIEAVGVNQEGDTLIGKIVKVKDGVFMYVNEVTISYTNRSVTIKGKIIRR